MPLNKQNVELVMTAGLKSQFPVDMLQQIAFSGRSNVGKSSLINALLGRKKLARVSSAPGKTITVNFYCVDRQMYLVDLPGYGFAKRSAEDQAKWSSLTDGYLQNNLALKLVVQLIDLKVGPTKDDDMMLDWLYHTGTPYIIVATKADKLNVTQKAKALENLQNDQMIRENTPVIPFSALKGTGTEDVWTVLEQVLEGEKIHV